MGPDLTDHARTVPEQGCEAAALDAGDVDRTRAGNGLPEHRIADVPGLFRGLMRLWRRGDARHGEEVRGVRGLERAEGERHEILAGYGRGVDVPQQTFKQGALMNKIQSEIDA